MADSNYEMLLVADDPDAIALVRDVFRRREHGPVHVVRSAQDALRFLRREGEHAGAPRPDLVLMDVQLPDRGGHELFAEIRADPALGPLTLVLMTSARPDSEIVMTCGVGGRCYVSRPASVEHFLRTLEAIEQFWFRVVRVPPRCLQ